MGCQRPPDATHITTQRPNIPSQPQIPFYSKPVLRTCPFVMALKRMRHTPKCPLPHTPSRSPLDLGVCSGPGSCVQRDRSPGGSQRAQGPKGELKPYSARYVPYTQYTCAVHRSHRCAARRTAYAALGPERPRLPLCPQPATSSSAPHSPTTVLVQLSTALCPGPHRVSMVPSRFTAAPPALPLQAFRDHRIGPHHFSGSTGYGHGDLGREALDSVSRGKGN